MMSIFPTQYSVLKAEALKDYLTELYNVKFVESKLIIHNVSDSYLVSTTENRFVLKVYRDAHRTREEIEGEVELLLYLYKNGGRVAVPIQSSRGDYLIRFEAAEGVRYGVLFTFAAGEVKTVMNDKQLQLLGREMARFHQLSSRIQLRHARRPYSIETTLQKPLQVIAPAFENLPEEYCFLAATAQQVEQEMSKLNPERFSYGYCQFDFLPKNFHFDGDNGITFFDFDFCGQGYLINDIASFYIHFFLEVTYKKMNRAEADRSFSVFLDSYRQAKPLSQEEIDSIRLFGFGFWMFYFQFHFEHFDDWSNFFFTPRFIKDRVQLIRKWMEY